jgi:O-acetylhomoserine (thiol)-lyase
MAPNIVLHSLTKFMGGHGNSMGGIIVDGGSFDWSSGGKYPLLSEPRPEYQGIVLHETFGNFAFAIACRVLGLRDLGPAISPFNSFMILTGIETLPLRMQRHSDNAQEGRQLHLSGQSRQGEAWVSYAGRCRARQAPRPAAEIHRPRAPVRSSPLASNGGYDVRRGKLVSKVWSCSRISPTSATPAALIIHPASTTHRQLSRPSSKTAAGAGPDVVRISVGIEDVDDIIADLDQALAKA